ncbi:recombinase family protein [Acutalibacter muris]|mgnify:FL=1|jgi:DNA invertase Pin-like site-specific DNA recombinase|uniref:recombinase family protein n=1 Tax=Acutalibacter muris TaxID=1796620 RepID=UPI0026F3AF03|nr:recombinase family protein [Acutalibacter muris]
MKSVMDTLSTISVTHGYARCSTNEEKQDIDRQTRELKKQGADRIWLEFEHGDAASKEQQALMLDTANPGDTIITLEVSRLARSTKQLCEIIDVIRDKHLRLIITGSIIMDCRDGCPDPMTEAFLQIAGVFSQLELSMIRARVKSGMANAKAKGKRIGRPPVSADNVPASFLRYYPRYQDGKISLTELSRLAQVSRPTAYRYISALKN